MSHIRGVDGMRAIAVSLVVVQHYVGDFLIGRQTDIGHVGVDIFFVISGFLITRILLSSKEDLSNTTATKLVTFYMRRALRIFPIYYLVVIIGFSLGAFWFVAVGAEWYALYATNIWMAKNNLFSGNTAHFWSLDVEEQFYLFWPFVVLFTPTRHVLKAIVGTVVAGYLSEVVLRAGFGVSELATYVLPFSHLSALGIGALVAAWKPAPALRPAPLGVVTFVLTLASVILWLSLSTMPGQEYRHSIVFLMSNCAITLVAVLLWQLRAGNADYLLPILSSTPLRFIGRRSYGLYLYHALVPGLFVGTAYSPQTGATLSRVLLYLAVSFALTMLSWEVIERPALRLKDRVDRLLGFRRRNAAALSTEMAERT